MSYGEQFDRIFGYTATEVETFRWCSTSKLRGYTIARGEERLAGLFVVDLLKKEESIQSLCNRLRTEAVYEIVDKKLVITGYPKILCDQIRSALQSI